MAQFKKLGWFTLPVGAIEGILIVLIFVLLRVCPDVPLNGTILSANGEEWKAPFFCGSTQAGLLVIFLVTSLLFLLGGIILSIKNVRAGKNL